MISEAELEIMRQRVAGNKFEPRKIATDDNAKTLKVTLSKKNKLNAQRTDLDGITFASKKEAERYQELRLMTAAGEIQNLVLQPRYEFPFKAHYTADFSYEIFGRLIVEELKGMRTEAFQLRLKCFMFFHPNIQILVNGVDPRIKKVKENKV